MGARNFWMSGTVILRIAFLLTPSYTTTKYYITLLNPGLYESYRAYLPSQGHVDQLLHGGTPRSMMAARNVDI